MSYKPLNIKPRNNEKTTYSFMGKKGVNLRDLPQLLSPENALNIQNYLVTTDGGLVKRNGVKRMDNIGAYPLKMAFMYGVDTIIFGWYTHISAYSLVTKTSSIIYTYAIEPVTLEGLTYGDYVFTTDNRDKIGRLSQELKFKSQTGNFTAGLVISGGTSGAKATILSQVDAGVTGTLTIGNITGTFIDGENITDTSTGVAVADGTQYWAYNMITKAPVCKNLSLFNARLVAIGLKEDGAASQYSDIDDGSNPPFDNWAISALADEGGQIVDRNFGQALSGIALGNIFIIWYTNGKLAFAIDIFDSAGTTQKRNVPYMQNEDFGGSRAVTQTDKGVFYANESGLWQLVSVGQSNIPYSQQENKDSILLGSTYFDNVDLTNADMVFDAKSRNIFLTCAKDSDVNNFIIAYNLEFQSFSFFSGLNISRFAVQEGVIYAGGTNGKLYQFLTGSDDDGADIWTEFNQELKVGNLETRQEIRKFYIQGLLSPSTVITVNFDIYDKVGAFVETKTAYTWTAQNATPLSDGLGTAKWGSSAWGGDLELSNLVESFDGAKVSIQNFQRVRVRFTCHDKAPHAINWFSIMSIVKALIRRRKMVKVV
jgi:hypothetical protein